MPAQTTLPKQIDPGLAAVVMLLRFHEISADAEQINHRFGGGATFGVTEILRCASEFGLKARAVTTSWGRLAKTPLPAIAALRDGGFLVLAKMADDKLLVQNPLAPRPQIMTRGELEAGWDGRILLLTRRRNLGDLGRRFDLTWFIGAIHKYRGLLTEVLIASLFLQIFALISPLFFQVVIDKVLVHRGLSTLDVLIIGLVAISIFETVLGGLRTYVFAHTTNRIDVELGARLFRHLLDEKFARGAENQAFLVEGVTGIETLKAMAVEPQVQRRWEEQLAGYVTASFRVINLGNAASQAVQLVSKIVTAGLLYFGAKLVIDGSLSVGELVAFNILAGRVSAPVLRLAQIWQDFHQARLSVLRLGDILNTMPEPTFTPGRARLPAIRGNIKFDHVTFRYRIDGQEVLHDVTFDVPAGQMVGIVGPSGSGKSTFAKLVQRLYVPESGRVLVDGMDLAMADPAWLRCQIGVVLQENVLFNRSVRENIALADPAMPMERVIAAARLAGAHEFILELAEGYDTVIGERGSTLSGGQRQRIAIARALITDPRILIFDEATSALDYESERVIQRNMREIAKGRTVLVIAHRLSTVRTMDRIVTLERGRVVEDGSHDTLIKTGGRYASLHLLQAGIHEIV